jgi:glycosyltransferase involved in cell wall biosynthesis
MRLVIVARALPIHHIGGMEAVAWDLARAMSSLEFDVRVLTTACPALPFESVRDGVIINALPGISGAYSALWAKSLRDIWRSRLSERADVVLSVSAGAFPLLDYQGAVPFVMQAHGTSWGEVVSKLAQHSPIAFAKATKNLFAMSKDIAYRRFDAIVAVGETTYQQLQSFPTGLLVGSTPVTYIPNGIDAKAFAFTAQGRSAIRAQYGVPPDAPVIISSSRLHAQKGVAESLAGVARARAVHPNLRYFIVGEGPASVDLREHASSLGITDAINFIGGVDRASLAKLLSAADVFLFTGLRQEVGITLSTLEALANGLPCITSYETADPALGLIQVSARDPQAIGAAIVRALSDLGSKRTGSLPNELTLEYAASRYQALFRDLPASRQLVASRRK